MLQNSESWFGEQFSPGPKMSTNSSKQSEDLLKDWAEVAYQPSISEFVTFLLDGIPTPLFFTRFIE